MTYSERLLLGRAVKEAMDNLPEGICFFNSYGLPVLCNHRMHELFFRMTGKDLQHLHELEEAVQAGENGVCTLPDGSIWRFTLQPVETGAQQRYTRAFASDVTELMGEYRRLEQANAAKRRSYATLERLQERSVAIAREEESLSVKMKIHNELGYHLQMIRRFLENGCQPGEKAELLARQRVLLRELQVRGRPEEDPLQMLTELLQSLQIRVTRTGEFPQDPARRELLTLILRECLINTVRHAHGDEVFVVISEDGGGLRVAVTNNGEPPTGPIQEGGGLTSLREQLEAHGGTMRIESAPVFRLTATLPQNGKETNVS